MQIWNGRWKRKPRAMHRRSLFGGDVRSTIAGRRATGLARPAAGAARGRRRSTGTCALSEMRCLPGGGRQSAGGHMPPAGAGRWWCPAHGLACGRPLCGQDARNGADPLCASTSACRAPSTRRGSPGVQRRRREGALSHSRGATGAVPTGGWLAVATSRAGHGHASGFVHPAGHLGLRESFRLGLQVGKSGRGWSVGSDVGPDGSRGASGGLTGGATVRWNALATSAGVSTAEGGLGPGWGPACVVGSCQWPVG